MAEGDEMQQNREVNVNWLRINVPSIAAIVVAAITVTVYIQKLEGRLDVIEQSRQARSIVADKNNEEIQDKLKPLDNVGYRLDQQDKRNDAQDARIDRLLDLMGTKFDALSKDVADVKADVRVVAQDVKNLSGKTQPTSFRSP
jgi:cell division protein ZapA (FtsZ GTPase activity inhibitor)